MERLWLGQSPLFSRETVSGPIIYRIVPDSLLSEIELLTRGIDLYGVSPFQFQRMKETPFLNVYSQPSLGYTYIGYNLI